MTDFEGSGPCKIQLVKKKQPVAAFCKVTHLLDPVRVCQGYYTDAEKGERRRKEKLENPMNQAYVDCVTNYILGQLRERNISPHFCLFYGGFQAIADTYKYNLTEEIESYRKYKGFWENRRAGLFDLEVVLEDDEEEAIVTRDDCDSELDCLLKTPKSSMKSINSMNFRYTTPSSTRSKKSYISLKDFEGQEQSERAATAVELESVGSFSDLEDGPEGAGPPSLERGSESEDSSSESSDPEFSCEVYAKFKDFPVALIFQEQNEGVLDDLLDDEEEVGAEAGTPEWEAKWTAWTFQVIAALCCAQGVVGFTHNDLHTNNIVWSATDQSWLWYRRRDGTTFRVPTYGKILRLIDFGRAVFRVGDQWIVSDDYCPGGDAEGQISFGEHRHLPSMSEMFPNPSFDLCRYSVSILESLFPSAPTEMLEGTVLSKEGDWIVHETESPLYNLLWSWLIDDTGRNVLQDQHGEERFPGFDLYTHINAHVHCAKPQEQLTKDIFRQYEIAAKDVGEWETVYPLFC